MKTIIMFFLISIIPTFGNDYLDLDTLWVSNVGGNPIGYSHDDSQILLQNDGIVNHIDANTGEYLFQTEGKYSKIHPFENYYATTHLKQKENSQYSPFLVLRNIYDGIPFDTIWHPNDIDESYQLLNFTFSPDGSKIATTGIIYYELNITYLILVFDIESKKAIKAISFNRGQSLSDLPFWSKDNQHIYAIDQIEEHKLNKINIFSGKVVKSFVFNNEDNSNRVMNAWVSDKGNYFFISSGIGLYAYNSENDEELYSLKHCILDLNCNLTSNFISNENRNMIVSYGRAEIGTASHRDTRIWNLTDGSHINTIWYNPRKFDGTDGWQLQISNKQNTKTLFLQIANSSNGGNKLFCVTDFWENPIINSVTNQEPDIRFSEEGNIINIQTQQGDNQITISNLSGAVVQTIPINQAMQLILINKQEFSAGTYFITVHNSSGVYNYQFIGGM